MANVNIDIDKLDATVSELTDTFSHTMKGIVEKMTAKETDDFGTDEHAVKAKDVQTRIQKWSDIWRNNGKVSATQKLQLTDMIEKSKVLAAEHANDAITSQWYRNMIPNVVSNVVREPISLGNPLTQLLSVVRFTKGTAISFPAVGASGGIDCDMGEGEEYPELDLDMSGNIMATIGKSGIACQFTEEAIRYSTFDIIGLHVRQALDVLKRHKEKKAADMIFNVGSVYINNYDSLARHSKGRSIDMVFNNTLIIDDLVDAALDGIREGWHFDTLIVHPMAWQIFAKDPIMREQFFRGLAAGKFFTPPIGQAAYFPQLGMNNPYGKNVGASTAVGLSNIAAGSLSFQVPGYAGFGFNVIVTNYAPIHFDGVINKYVTDIAMIQSDQAGLLVVDEDLTNDDWTDPARDIHKMKFRERYSLVNLSQGKAGRILKGIVIDRAYFVEDKVRWDAATAPFPSSSSTLTP